MGMKRYCSQCFAEKPLSEFFIDRGLPTASCKECKRSVARLTKAERAERTRQRAAADSDWLAAYIADPEAAIARHLGDWPADEVWRPVARYLGYYEVSDQGRVRSIWFKNINANQRRPIPLVLTQFQHASGYRSVSLCPSKGVKVTEHVHTLVCEAFHGARPDGLLCGHRDGDGANNAASNLGWITHVENEADKRRHGRTMSGSRNHQSKLTERQVVELRARVAAGGSPCSIAPEYGVSGQSAWKAATRRTWKHVA